MTSAAATARLGVAPFTDVDQCKNSGANAYCGNFLKVATGMTNPAVISGDTAECRVYHANVGLQISGATDAPTLATSTAHFSHGLPAPTALGTCTPAGTSGNYTPAAEVYCDKIIDACGLSAADPVYGQFANREQCLRVAATYPRSTAVNSQGGNTLDCRLYHAGVAGNAAFHDAHCEHSGANGKGVCGTSCEGYCQVIMAGCTGNNAQFRNLVSCLAWCATYPTDGAERPYATGNDTYQCHIYHAQVAVQRTDIANVHCTHAGPTGDGVCGATHRCRAFCRGQIAACGVTGGTVTGGGQYASQAACETSCASWTVGTFGTATTSGNTLACRAYHASVAIESTALAAAHCSHTGVTGDGVCVTAFVSSSSGSTVVTSSTGTVTPTTSSGINGATGVTASIGLVAALVVAVVAL